MEQELENLKSQIHDLSSKIDSMEYKIASQHFDLVQSLNMQISLLNQMSQTINTFNGKLADIEIRSNYTDDSIRDLIDTNNSTSQELQDIKNAIEAMKFYALGFNHK